jgi:hypothetical protein
MPLVRYEVRCEHSLANPELYRSAARDDPESLWRAWLWLDLLVSSASLETSLSKSHVTVFLVERNFCYYFIFDIVCRM